MNACLLTIVKCKAHKKILFIFSVFYATLKFFDILNLQYLTFTKRFIILYPKKNYKILLYTISTTTYQKCLFFFLLYFRYCYCIFIVTKTYTIFFPFIYFIIVKAKKTNNHAVKKCYNNCLTCPFIAADTYGSMDVWKKNVIHWLSIRKLLKHFVINSLQF